MKTFILAAALVLFPSASASAWDHDLDLCGLGEGVVVEHGKEKLISCIRYDSKHDVWRGVINRHSVTYKSDKPIWTPDGKMMRKWRYNDGKKTPYIVIEEPTEYIIVDNKNERIVLYPDYVTYDSKSHEWIAYSNRKELRYKSSEYSAYDSDGQMDEHPHKSKG